VSAKHLVRIASLSLLLIGLLWPLTPPARGAPVAPGLSVVVNPEELVPGQAGYVFVGGGYPLQVEVTLDNTPLEVFWTGSGYEALFAFGLDAPAGTHSLVIHAVEPSSGTVVDQTSTLQVDVYAYPRESVALPYRLQPLLDKTLNQNELDMLEKIYAVHTHPSGFDWPFAVPVPGGIVTSRFGGDRSYNGGVLRARHTGMDFRRSIGEPVQATAEGRVVLAEYLNIRGNVVILDHGHGVFSQYAHLSQFQVAVGQVVHKGQVIGLAGSTGRANGPHLHFEVIVNGYPVDPLRWLALAPGFAAPREATPVPSQPLPTGS
jgi:Peptidase family M23